MSGDAIVPGTAPESESQSQIWRRRESNPRAVPGDAIPGLGWTADDRATAAANVERDSRRDAGEASPVEGQLFGRGDYAEHRDLTTAPVVEHATLPQAVVRERAPSLTLSFDSEADRNRLVGLLAIRVSGTASRWSCYWPDEPEDLSLRLDLGDAA